MVSSCFATENLRHHRGYMTKPVKVKHSLKFINVDTQSRILISKHSSNSFESMA